jgi:predicted acyl esterase
MKSVFACWLWIGLWLVVGTSQSLAADDLDLGKVREEHVLIPMRDGIRLSAYLYFPAGDGPWPVLFEQRYAGLRDAGTRKQLAQLAEHGYVVAGVNFRGTHLSEGRYIGYRGLQWGELRDGFDTCEWLGTQKWSTGKVGTFGSSQAGYAQNYLAVTQPPHLVAQYMIDTGLSLYHEGYRIGGSTRPIRFQQMADVCRDKADNRRLMEEWFAHPNYDDYWRAEDASLHFDKMNVPCFTIGSWYDFMCVGSVESFIGRQHRAGPNSRGQQQLLIGPWLHGRFNKAAKVGQLTYPDNANFDAPTHMLKWFDHYLKGSANGIEKDPAVRYYVMGAVGEANAPGNEWRTATDWPLKTAETSYFLRSDKSLQTVSPVEQESKSTFLADPFKPAEIPGRGFPGAQDARPFEAQAEVLTFTTEPLAEPVEWTGKAKAELFVTSDARDTDFIVRISDVYPDGRSILIVDMIRRARYRDGYESEQLMTPGQVYKVAFDVGWLSQNFNKGHRIRVTVASTGAPFYEPNPNTGDVQTIDPPQRQVIAKNTVFHQASRASRILAPVMSTK